MSPAARPTATASMLLASLGGMAVGFLVDSGALGPETLASLCQETSSTLAISIVHHWTLLRATLVGMVAAGVLVSAVDEIRDGATPRLPRLGFSLLRHLAMVAGMLLAGWIGPPLAAALGVAWTA